MATYQRPATTVSPVSAALRMTPLSVDVQAHMVKVYRTLCTCVCAAAAGAAFEMRMGMFGGGGGGALVLSVALFAAFAYFVRLPPYSPRRAPLLHGVALLQGLATGPLLTVAAVHVDPWLPVSALAATAAVFLGLTCSAMFARRRSYLMLGGALSTGLSMLLLASMLNVFVPSSVGFAAQLYGGLALFCGYILYDTQMIIEKAELGDKDHLRHALELFLDLVAVFRRLVVIMMKNQESKQRKKRREDRS
jgi:Bax inhibitor 1